MAFTKEEKIPENFSKEGKIAESFSKEVKPVTGELAGEFDIGAFDTAVFDANTGIRVWKKEDLNAQGFTKEAKPL